MTYKRDIPMPWGVAALPRTEAGIPISYSVAWTSERGKPLARVDPLLSQLGVTAPGLFHGGQQGDGEPILTASDVARTRRIAILGLCQVCGRKLPPGSRWLADLRNHNQEIEIEGRRVPLCVDGWTCDPCMRYSVQICPGLARRRPMLFRVWRWELVATLEQVEGLDEVVVGWVKIAPTNFAVVPLVELAEDAALGASL